LDEPGNTPISEKSAAPDRENGLLFGSIDANKLFIYSGLGSYRTYPTAGGKAEENRNLNH
jgi:hypothetical protein